MDIELLLTHNYAFNLPFLKIRDLKTETLQDIWEKESAWQLMRGGITISQLSYRQSRII